MVIPSTVRMKPLMPKANAKPSAGTFLRLANSLISSATRTSATAVAKPTIVLYKIICVALLAKLKRTISWSNRTLADSKLRYLAEESTHQSGA